MRALPLATLAGACQVLADCTCSYSINATTGTDNYAIFTEHLETDFTRPKTNTLTFNDEQKFDWAAQAYNVTPSAARGSYGKNAELTNVVLSSEDLGLELWVRSQLTEPGDGQMVPIAEVVSTRNDMLYGSFRVGMKTTNVSGTCGAFFFYHNDSQEIDMEMLSREQNASAHPVNLVLQSPDSVAAGFNAANTSGFVPYNLSFDPSAEYHDYRFDWLPDRIDMYADGQWLHTFTDGVLNSAGAIHLIHWSNGDPSWSGTPPAQDAVLTVSYVEAYFNSSQGVLASSGDGCGDGGSAGIACEIGDGPAPQPISHAPTPTDTGVSVSSSAHNDAGAMVPKRQAWSMRGGAWLAVLLLYVL